MRIGYVSYPMLFQGRGGLQVQISETVNAVREKYPESRFFRFPEDHVSDFDIIHVFSAINGNHRIVEACRNRNVPVVVSPVLHPPFGRRQRWFCMLTRSFLGHTVSWNIRTTYDDIRACLEKASWLFALSEQERAMLITGFGQKPEKISVVPNGIAEAFFKSNPDLFDKKLQKGRPVIINVGNVGPTKNQEAAGKVLKNIDANLYLFGDCTQDNQSYLDRVVKQAPGKVWYCGSFPASDPMLVSAYAAADLMLFPSRSEVMPIAVLEALAAGTPVVMTKNHCLDIPPCDGVLEMYDPNDVEKMEAACRRILAYPPNREDVKNLVSGFRWGKVAESVTEIYEKLAQS